MKKNILIGIAAMGLSLVLLIAFIIGGVTKIQTGPAAVVEKLEKALNKGNYEKAMTYFGMDGNYLATEYDILGLQEYGYDINLIAGDYVENEDGSVTMKVACVYKEGTEVVYDISTFDFIRYNNQWIIDIF